MRVSDWKSYQKNTLKGFFTLHFTNGVSVADCSLHFKDGRHWFSFPSKPYEKAGRTEWKNLVFVEDKDHLAVLQDAVITLLYNDGVINGR